MITAMLNTMFDIQMLQRYHLQISLIKQLHFSKYFSPLNFAIFFASPEPNQWHMYKHNT